MLVLECEITIGNDTRKWQFNAVHNVSIIEDTSSLTDTCELQIPKNTQWEGEVMDVYKNPPIKRGDSILVKLGYRKTDGNEFGIKTRFEGFVRTVDVKNPLMIKCEDGMFLLKTKETKKRAYRSVTLDTLISDLLKGSDIQYELIDKNVNIGSYRITKPTVAEELNELKRKLPLKSYFRNIDGISKLYVGFSYPFDNRKHEKFVHGKNIISENLEYRRKEDIKLKIKATSNNAKTNKIVKVELGDKDGEVQEIHIPNLSEAELKKFAQRALDVYKTSGFKGSIQVFGEPLLNKCDIVEILASDGNKGSFLIKKLETSFGVNGYRQNIELGPPLEIEKINNGR